MFKPTRIILHHSATRDSGTVSWGAIRWWHTEGGHEWSDIGYHAGIEWVTNGRRQGYECLVGRPTTEPGAHTKGHNFDSLGFCFVGNYDDLDPEDEMLHVDVRRVILQWCVQFGIRSRSVFPHRLFSPKTCPGERFDVDVVRELVRQGLERYGR